MRQIKRNLTKDGGSITLFPEEPEDMWHLYNLLEPKDRLRATALRKVQNETSTGSTTTTRVRTTLTIIIEKTDFDVQAGALHVAGPVAEENKYVKMGSYHTLDLEIQRNVTIIKDEWDSIALERIRDACDVSKKAEVGAVVLQEGLANVCLLTEHMTILRQRIETSIPRKDKGSSSKHDKALVRFYETIYQSMLRNFDLESLKVILLASPGFSATSLREHILAQATLSGLSSVLKSKSKFLVVHCSTGHLHSLNEVLKSDEVKAKLADTKFARESRAVDEFYKMIGTDETRAYYGPKHVLRAVEAGAVGTLLISDSLFRSQDVGERRKWVGVVEDVRKSGGEVLIFSSIHESGKQLDQLTGVAAILNFPLPELESDDEEEGNEGEGARQS